jgi:hypothetical protein
MSRNAQQGRTGCNDSRIACQALAKSDCYRPFQIVPKNPIGLKDTAAILVAIPLSRVCSNGSRWDYQFESTRSCFAREPG